MPMRLAQSSRRRGVVAKVAWPSTARYSDLAADDHASAKLVLLLVIGVGVVPTMMQKEKLVHGRGYVLLHTFSNTHLDSVSDSKGLHSVT